MRLFVSAGAFLSNSFIAIGVSAIMFNRLALDKKNIIHPREIKTRKKQVLENSTSQKYTYISAIKKLHREREKQAAIP